MVQRMKKMFSVEAYQRNISCNEDFVSEQSIRRALNSAASRYPQIIRMQMLLAQSL